MWVFAACSAENTVSDDGKISVVATIFPEYDWASNIIGDLKNNYDLTLLLDNGVDLHSYQPTTEDIMKISTCDLFIYVGGESDAWVSDALTEAVNKDMKVINLMDVLGSSVQEEKIVPGMRGNRRFRRITKRLTTLNMMNMSGFRFCKRISNLWGNQRRALCR